MLPGGVVGVEEALLLVVVLFVGGGKTRAVVVVVRVERSGRRWVSWEVC